MCMCSIPIVDDEGSFFTFHVQVSFRLEVLRHPICGVLICGLLLFMLVGALNLDRLPLVHKPLSACFYNGALFE